MSTPEPVAPLPALVIDPDPADLFFVISALTLGGFHVTVADSFHEASAILGSRPPAVMVTEVRLGEYNGLHLLLKGRSARPNMAVVVTSRWVDQMLVSEAEAMGGTFVSKPTSKEELLAAVFRTLFRPIGEAGGRPIRPPFERRHTTRRGVGVSTREPDRRHQPDRRHDPAVLLQLQRS